MTKEALGLKRTRKTFGALNRQKGDKPNKVRVAGGNSVLQLSVMERASCEIERFEVTTKNCKSSDTVADNGDPVQDVKPCSKGCKLPKQGVHIRLPFPDANVEPGHRIQLEDPNCEANDPGGHKRQLVALLPTEKDPGEHCSEDDIP